MSDESNTIEVEVPNPEPEIVLPELTEEDKKLFLELNNKLTGRVFDTSRITHAEAEAICHRLMAELAIPLVPVYLTDTPIQAQIAALILFRLGGKAPKPTAKQQYTGPRQGGFSLINSEDPATDHFQMVCTIWADLAADPRFSSLFDHKTISIDQADAVTVEMQKCIGRPGLPGSFAATTYPLSTFELAKRKGCKLSEDCDDSKGDVYRMAEILGETLNLGPVFSTPIGWMVSQKPTIVKRDGTRWHSETGPALLWGALDNRFAYGMFALNGIVVPKRLVTTPAEELDPAEWVFDTNLSADIRAEGFKKIGPVRMAENAEVIATVKNTDPELWKQSEYKVIDFSKVLRLEGGRRAPYLYMKNLSTGAYHVEGVPAETRSVKEALAFRANLSVSEYEKYILTDVK